MKAEEALQRIVPESIAYGAPMVCPECGRPITVKVLIGPFSKFPILECLAKIIICDDCADFRCAFRNSEDEIIRLLRWYRQRAHTILSKPADSTHHEEKLKEIRKQIGPEFTVRLARFARIIARRSGRSNPPTETLSATLLDIFEHTTSYDGEDHRKVHLYDQTGAKLREFAASFGIVIANHWKDDSPP